MATNIIKLQQNTYAIIKNLETQMNQLTTTVGRLEIQAFGKLHSQTVRNLKENVNDINLKSNKELDESKQVFKNVESKDVTNQKEELKKGRSSHEKLR